MEQKNNLSTKMKLKQKKKGKRSKTLVIIICAIFALAAPFAHVLLPKNDPEFVAEKYFLDKKLQEHELSDNEYVISLNKIKEKHKVFGFTNARKFWNIFGRHICMFFLSIVLMYTTFYVNDKEVKKISTIFSFLFMGVSVFFIVWCLWCQKDFSELTYFMAMVVMSLTITSMFYLFMIHFGKIAKYLSNIKKLTRFIVVYSYDNYIKEGDKEKYDNDIVKLTKTLE